MDNLCHTLTGTALAGAGLRRLSPLATAALVVGANIPDVDALVYTVGDAYAGLAFRRGITHGLPALVLWPFVVVGLLIAWDRLVRARRWAPAEPVRTGPLLLAAAVGVFSHPSMDWLNTYGMRWLMPLSDRWSYGDALFIVDPWLWLGLAAATVLAWTWTARGTLGWTLVALITTALVLVVGAVPGWVRVLWLLGMAAIAAAAHVRPAADRPGRRIVPRALVAACAAYVGVMLGSSWLGERRVRDSLESAGVRGIEEVLVGPVAADPFRREVVVAAPGWYRRGSYHWGRSPALSLEPDSIPRIPGGAPAGVVEAAVATREARDFLRWSRFPYFVLAPADDGWWVHLRDARYAGRNGLSGPSVRVGSDGRAWIP